MYNDQRNSKDSRPSSITRSVRGSFSSELEVLPPEKVDQQFFDLEISEEVAVVEIDEEIEEDPQSNVEPKLQDSLEDNIESASSTPDTVKEESELERKIRLGLKKIEKLDKVLIQKIQKEKEVKRERVALQRDFQNQVQHLIEEKGVENVVGGQQLLSLCAADDGVKGTIDYVTGNEDYIGPIFATQIDSEFYKEHHEHSNFSTTNQKECEEEVTGKTKSTDKNKKKTDFIKRNINLAAHANETIALTDDEKKRLDELLADDNDLLIGENPFSTPALKDDGFQFSMQDQKSLEEIDAKLKDFLPDFDLYTESILGQSQISIQTVESNNTLNSLEDTQTRCGEKVLDDGQNAKGLVLRLIEIEKRLNDLRLTVDTSDQQTIDPDLLRSLLEVDSRMTSDSKSICDSMRSHSQIFTDRDDVSELLSVMSSKDTTLDLDATEVHQETTSNEEQ